MSTTLTEFKARTLRRADMSVSDFPDLSSGGEVETYIQEAGEELYDEIIAVFGEDYFYDVSSVNTVAGTATVDLPSDFKHLLGVDAAVPGATTNRSLEKFNWNERNIFEDNVGWNWDIAIPRYRLRAGKIWFIPTPQDVHAVTIHYVPTFTPIDDSTNVWTHGFDEFIPIRAAIKLLRREESDTVELERELEAQRARIRRIAPHRDLDKPPTVVDVYVDRIGWDDL